MEDSILDEIKLPSEQKLSSWHKLIAIIRLILIVTLFAGIMFQIVEYFFLNELKLNSQVAFSLLVLAFILIPIFYYQIIQMIVEFKCVKACYIIKRFQLFSAVLSGALSFIMFKSTILTHYDSLFESYFIAEFIGFLLIFILSIFDFRYIMVRIFNKHIEN